MESKKKSLSELLKIIGSNKHALSSDEISDLKEDIAKQLTGGLMQPTNGTCTGTNSSCTNTNCWPSTNATCTNGCCNNDAC